MSKYWCKCGRVVNKSTSAATTGNRDTAGCEGCPHLLPYGPFAWDESKGAFARDVQGYECRTTNHPVDYTTHISSLGGPTDKTVLHIESLDFPFLEAISAWVKETFEDELTGGFDRDNLRSTDYLDGVRVSFYPSQNKKGVAAKQRLFQRFFHPDGTRLDMTPEKEKAKVLADIEKGKDAAQNKECQMKDKVYKDAKGILYRVGETGELGNADRCRLTIQQLGITPGALWRKKSMAPNWSMAARKDALQALDIMAEENDWKEATEAEVQYNLTERAALLDDDPDGTSLYSLDLSERTIRYLEEAGVDTAEELEGLLECEKDKIQEISTADMDKINAYLRKNSQNPADNLPWSAAATAAESQSAENPEAAASEPTTETAVTISEKPGDVSAPVPASADLPAAFDYSGLDEQTVVDLHLAAHEYTRGKELIEMGLHRMADGVAIAHDTLCGGVVQALDNSKHGNRGEDTFRAWCSSMGMSKSSAYSLLQVAEAYHQSSPNQQKLLNSLPKTLLYDYAKPSTPEEVKQGILSGDITTHKQYQEKVAELKQTQQENKTLQSQNEGLRTQNKRLLHSYETEHERVKLEKERADAAERERDTAVQDARRAQEEQERSERLADDEIARVQQIADNATDRADAAEAQVRELQSRPIEVTGADAADIARWREEGAAKARQETAAETEELRAQIEDMDQREEIIIQNLFAQARHVADSCMQLLEGWRQSAQCLEEEDYIDCVEQFTPLRGVLLRLMLYSVDGEAEGELIQEGERKC